MKANVMGPMAIGGLAGVFGAAAAVFIGLPLLAVFAAYSLCGAAGVLLGGVANVAAGRSQQGAPRASAMAGRRTAG